MDSFQGDEAIIKESATIPAAAAGSRLDQAVAQLFPQYSRARLQQWIKSGQLTVNNKAAKGKQKVYGGEQVLLEATLVTEGEWVANEIALDIVFEDRDILVINKPIDFVVHPAAGHHEQTLLNALLYHLPAQKKLPRAGIVHRLDKDTSGLMVVAKSLVAHNSLVKQLKVRSVQREYVAIVNGVVRAPGTINKPVGRHPTQRIKMAVVENGKPAVTHMKVLARYRAHSLLQLNLETGRTHQIRVHLASIRHPIVGDLLYGGRPRLPAAASSALVAAIQQSKVQALHARKLCFDHPKSGELMNFQVPIREDMELLTALLAENALE